MKLITNNIGKFDITFINIKYKSNIFFYHSIIRMTLIKITLTESDIENPTIHDVEAGVVSVLCRKAVAKYSLMK